MIKFKKLASMLCLVLLGAWSYAHNTDKTEKNEDGTPIEVIEPNGSNEHPVQWEVIPDEQVFYPDHYCTYYHNLKVTYGRSNMAQNQNNY